MAKNELVFKFGLTVDDETAERCCNILSMYLTDNPQLDLQVNKHFCKNRVMADVSICGGGRDGKE